MILGTIKPRIRVALAWRYMYKMNRNRLIGLKMPTRKEELIAERLPRAGRRTITLPRDI